MKSFFIFVRAYCPFILIAIAILLVVCIYQGATNFNDHEKTVTVVKAERIEKDSDSKYLIFCEDENGKTVVFENTDIWLRGKFNSSDFYGQIESGETYTFMLVGYRIPIFSMYENILEIKTAE